MLVTGGAEFKLGETVSYALAAWNISCSSKGRPINCNPIGSPSGVSPQGILIAGNPVEFVGDVFLEIMPDPGPLTGYSSPSRANLSSSIRGAGIGAVGVANKSIFWNTRACSSFIIRWTFIDLE